MYSEKFFGAGLRDQSALDLETGRQHLYEMLDSIPLTDEVKQEIKTDLQKIESHQSLQQAQNWLTETANKFAPDNRLHPDDRVLMQELLRDFRKDISHRSEL